MKTVVVKEIEMALPSELPVLDLTQMTLKQCIGCWNCWWTTPGRCIHKDLDTFYYDYLAADQVVFFVKVHRGFVTGKVKTLLDRMIPHFLPYCIFKDGGSAHSPRYSSYPDIVFYYDGEFETKEFRDIFYDYIHRVFDQFYSKNIIIQPLAVFKESEVLFS